MYLFVVNFNKVGNWYFPESFDFAKRTLPNCSTLFGKAAIFSSNYCVIMFELVGRELHCYITCFQVEAFV